MFGWRHGVFGGNRQLEAARLARPMGCSMCNSAATAGLTWPGRPAGLGQLPSMMPSCIMRLAHDCSPRKGLALVKPPRVSVMQVQVIVYASSTSWRMNGWQRNPIASDLCKYFTFIGHFLSGTCALVSWRPLRPRQAPLRAQNVRNRVILLI
jgi:hypothetical protein